MRNQKHFWLGAALVGVALLLPAATSAQSRNRSGWSWSDNDGPKETETVERTVPFPNNGTLHLKNFSGDIHIVAGNGHDLVIKARRSAPRERLDHIKLDVQSSGSSVTVNANKPDSSWTEKNNNVVETTMEITLPADARLDVDAFSSDVVIERVTGSQRLKTFSGDVTVRDPRGADIEAETFSGDIRVDAGSNAKGSVSFHSFSGSFEGPLNVTSMSRRKRDIEGSLPGGSGPRLSFKTFSGDLTIR